jgi:hypothetical protein
MNRRTALLLSMLLGGLVPASLQAQSSPRRVANSRDRTLQPVARERSDSDDTGSDSELPSSIPREPGFELRKWDISPYTRLVTTDPNPQKALIDWIFLRTGPSEWHGDRIAVLSANRSRLVAYQSTEVLKQVEEIVDRFINATDDVLSLKVQFVAAVDTRWRYTMVSYLTRVGAGPQGQQIWTMRRDDAMLVLSHMQMQQGFRVLAKRGVEMINGQTLTVRTSDTRSYAGSLQRDLTSGLAFQPRPEKLEEGIVLRISPLLNFDGNGVDAKLDLTVNTVRSFHRTKVIAPREIGPAETSIDVPEATQTRLEQTIKNWPLGQTLVISSGIHPGILDKKSGWFNLPIPGTYPTGTEVLVFLDIETVARGRGVREGRDTRTRTGTGDVDRTRTDGDSDQVDQ